MADERVQANMTRHIKMMLGDQAVAIAQLTSEKEALTAELQEAHREIETLKKKAK